MFRNLIKNYAIYKQGNTFSQHLTYLSENNQQYTDVHFCNKNRQKIKRKEM